MELELKEVEDKHLNDFSKSERGFGLSSRICSCGAMHLSMHNKEGVIYAHVDFIDPDGVMQLAQTFFQHAGILRELRLKEKNDELQISSDKQD